MKTKAEDDRIAVACIVAEKIAETKISQIDAEKESLLKKIAKENKELKLALQNKTKDPLATIGTHTESQGVQDTSITPEQMKAFKEAKNWSDQRYRTLQKELRSLR